MKVNRKAHKKERLAQKIELKIPWNSMAVRRLTPAQSTEECVLETHGCSTFNRFRRPTERRGRSLILEANSVKDSGELIYRSERRNLTFNQKFGISRC